MSLLKFKNNAKKDVSRWFQKIFRGVQGFSQSGLRVSDFRVFISFKEFQTFDTERRFRLLEGFQGFQGEFFNGLGSVVAVNKILKIAKFDFLWSRARVVDLRNF